MPKFSNIITLYSLQSRDYHRHPLLIKAINDKNFKIKIFDLGNILRLRNNIFSNESLPSKKWDNITYIRLNSLINLINLKKNEYACLYRVPKIFTSSRDFIIMFIISKLFKNLIIYDLNPAPEFLLFNKNFNRFIKEKYYFLKEKSNFYYYFTYKIFTILKFLSDIVSKQLKYKYIFVSGSILEKNYKNLNRDSKIIRTSSFDYKKLEYNKSVFFREKQIGKNNNKCKNLYYIDGGHLNHKDQESNNKKQDCNGDSWEKLLNSLFVTYAKDGYKITIFKHPNLKSNFYENQNLNIKNNIFDLLYQDSNNDLIICSSLTLSLLIPFFNYDFILLFDESITKSKLNTDIKVLKQLFPKNTFVQNTVKKVLYPGKINHKNLNNIKNLFLK